MTLLRAASRTLLASYFVTSGVKALRNPDALVPAAQPVADRLVPLVKQYAPEQVASIVPEDARTLVRVNGATQVLGGLALATGKGRRAGALLLAGSLVPSTIAKYPFWSRSDPLEKAQDRAHFGKNVSLLGGVLLAAVDTEGKPSLAWRARKSGQLLAKDTRRASKRLGKKTGISTSALTKNASELADVVSKNTSQFTDSALAGGAALVGAAVANSRKARKQLEKQRKAAQEAAAQRAKEAKKEGAKRAKAHEKEKAKQDQIAAREQARQDQITAKQQAKQEQIAAKEQAKLAAIAAKEGAKQAKVAEKKATKINKNIKLGAN